MKEIALSQKVKWAISTKIYFLKNKIIKKYYFLIYNYNSWLKHNNIIRFYLKIF
jgi:hypothetical protein